MYLKVTHNGKYFNTQSKKPSIFYTWFQREPALCVAPEIDYKVRSKRNSSTIRSLAILQEKLFLQNFLKHYQIFFSLLPLRLSQAYSWMEGKSAHTLFFNSKLYILKFKLSEVFMRLTIWPKGYR